MKKNCLLSKLMGTSKKKGNMYEFDLINGKKVVKAPIYICDPSYNSTFKIMFLRYPKRLAFFLNSLYFLENGYKIIELHFLPNELPAINEKYNFNLLREDILCICKIHKRNDKNGYVSETVLDVNVQISWKKDLEKNLFNNRSEMMRIYQQNTHEIGSYVVCIILDTKKNDSSEIKMINSEFISKKEIEIDFLKIVEINLYSQIQRIMRKDINGSCNDKDEWMKFLGLRFWCQRSSDNRFILPGEELSHNISIIQCCSELRALNNIYLDMIYEIEHHEENLQKKVEISTYFKAYKANGQNFKFPKLDYRYKEKEVRKILKDFFIENNIEKEDYIVEEFIKKIMSQK